MKPLRGVELKRFLRAYKRSHGAGREVAVLLQSVEYPYNVGAIFRLADGAGLKQVILTGITPTPPNPTITKVGRNKDRNVPWRYESKPEDALRQLKEQGYMAIALELTGEALPYDDFDYPDKVCLVVGHEDHGVTKELLAHCDAAIFIPMYGKGRSLNVSTALSIASYHIRQLD